MVINIAQLHLTESELSFSLYFIYLLPCLSPNNYVRPYSRRKVRRTIGRCRLMLKIFFFKELSFSLKHLKWGIRRGAEW